MGFITGPNSLAYLEVAEHPAPAVMPEHPGLVEGQEQAGRRAQAVLLARQAHQEAAGVPAVPESLFQGRAGRVEPREVAAVAAQVAMPGVAGLLGMQGLPAVRERAESRLAARQALAGQEQAAVPEPPEIRERPELRGKRVGMEVQELAGQLQGLRAVLEPLAMSVLPEPPVLLEPRGLRVGAVVLAAPGAAAQVGPAEKPGAAERAGQ
jgi:hypothetical protein